MSEKQEPWQYEVSSFGGWLVWKDSKSNSDGNAFYCESDAAAARACVILNALTRERDELRATVAKLRVRLGLFPNLFHSTPPDESYWWMTEFTKDQFEGNWKAMNEILASLTPNQAAQAAGGEQA